MYVRPPAQGKEEIKIPDNYSGNAFSPYQPSKIRAPSYPRDLPREEFLQKEYIKRPPERSSAVSSEPYRYNAIPSATHYGAALGGDTDPDIDMLETYAVSEKESEASDISERSGYEKASERSEKRRSLLSSVLPSELLKNNFPFGHGIGSEEILILAMMFLVFSSSEDGREPDTELMILLALLLFAG